MSDSSVNSVERIQGQQSLFLVRFPYNCYPNMSMHKNIISANLDIRREAFKENHVLKYILYGILQVPPPVGHKADCSDAGLSILV